MAAARCQAQQPVVRAYLIACDVCGCGLFWGGGSFGACWLVQRGRLGVVP